MATCEITISDQLGGGLMELNNARNLKDTKAQVKGPQAHTGGLGVSPSSSLSLGWGGVEGGNYGDV